MTTSGARADSMAEFVASAGWGAAKYQPLPSDASSRRYTRLRLGSRTAMLMDQPPSAEAPSAGRNATPSERRALGYNALARLAGADCGRFVAAAGYLRGRGLAAPEIYASAVADGFLLLEDFGDDLYTDVLGRGGDERALYAAAIDSLAQLHAAPAPETLAPDKPLFPYDETAMLAEIDLLTEWFLPVVLARPATTGEIEDHRAQWSEIFRTLDSGASVFVHRDFHAQNLIWREGSKGVARVGMLDFQDALAGSAAYDLVSLLEDARRDVSPSLTEDMTKHYLAKRQADGAMLDPARFRADAAILAAQRNAKIIGIFARLAKRDGKPRYLAHLPRVWRYMEKDLAHPTLHGLRLWYDAILPRDRRSIPQPEATGSGI